MKRCRYSQCRQKFEPQFRTTEICCSTDHAIAYVRESSPERLERQRAQIQRAERTEAKERLRRRRDWVKLAQEAFNAYIRARDQHLPCVSCGRDTGAKRNAGHFRSVGAAPQLRFDEQNCHGQCEHCNSFLSGNQLEYRSRLVGRIGGAALERLETDNSIRRHTVDELKAVISTYRAKLREMRKAAA